MRQLSQSLLTLTGLSAFLDLGCSAQPSRTAEVKPSASMADSKGAESRLRASKRFGYSWALADGWEFVDPSLFWPLAPAPAIDVYAAQHSPQGPFILMIATDVMHVVPGKHAGDDPEDYDRLEGYGAEVLQAAHAELINTQRVRMFGLETVQVTGAQGKLRISIRMLYRGYRKFEFRCFDLDSQSDWRCASALSAFRVEDLPEPETERDPPQVRHLRDARFGVAFDAPDDSWLSLGPHVAGGGAQLVWTWGKSGRQIDIQVMDLEAMPSQPDQTTFATEMARSARASGDKVVETHDTFAGQLWDHHELTRKGKKPQDVFFLIHQGVMYSVLVTQPIRDQRLIAAAKSGFRLIARSSAVSP